MSRWIRSRGLTAALVAMAFPFTVTTAGGEEASSWLAYVGTYTRGESEGIYVFRFDRNTGKADELRLAAPADNPSFLAIHPTKPCLYAVNEVVEFEGQASGAITAFTIDVESGELKRLNQQASTGGAPCHLVVDATGRNVLVANYMGGNVAVLPIRDDGHLQPASSAIQHEGSSVNPRRQQEPHAHSINLDARNRFALAADLGIDRILVYRFDPDGGTLKANRPDSARLAAGAGPRHLAFHPNNRFVYVINELNLSVTAFTFDERSGALEQFQTVATVPPGISTQGFSTAEVLVHPSGKFLYGSNRGHHSIAMFAIDSESGRLSPLGQEPTQGETPRNFAIDPSGQFLLAENQASDTVVVFRIDPASGKLEATGHVIEVPSPVCIRFFDTQKNGG